MPDEAYRLAESFEEHREHLRAVAYRMLGSLSDADDAVQEAWLRLNRTEWGQIRNLGGWLTTAVSRICLDMLRSRRVRREEPLPPEPRSGRNRASDPEEEALLAESVGAALLVLLDQLTPAERVAFVLHDVFAVSFEQIGAALARSPAAARQLASRARRRLRGTDPSPPPDLAVQRGVVEAFLDALRQADSARLLDVLDPDVTVRIDEFGTLSELRGSESWATDAVAYSKIARFAEPVLVDGDPGAVFAPRGRLFSVLRFRISRKRIVEAEIIVNPARFPSLTLRAF